MADLARVLAIDFGTARIGLALSDDLGLMAHPLETLHTAKPGADPAGRIAEIVRERGIKIVLLGWPVREDGTEGLSVRRVKSFQRTLEKQLPDGVNLERIDERFSTSMAMEKLHAAGRNTKNSRHIIDQAAAVEILREYLAANAPPEILAPPEEDENEWT